jgi:hypothetical protein
MRRAAGYTKWDRKRNEDITDKLKIKTVKGKGKICPLCSPQLSTTP